MATVINTRIQVSELRVGDLFVAARDRRSQGVVAEVRHITKPSHAKGSRVIISDYTVHYSVTDDASGLCYGGDVSLPPRSLVTRVEVI